MKIAIKGHESKGKEVIQILESLGGKKLYYSNAFDKYLVFFIDDKGYISCIHHESPLVKECFKIYTLEEFEKEFPFKIGDEVIFPIKLSWLSGKVTGLTYVEDQLKYEVDTRIAGYRYIEPHKLSLYPMKEERNITLTLDKAKEWYKKGGELKEIALQAFTEKELNSLPRSWEEFCKNYPVRIGESWLGIHDTINVCNNSFHSRCYKNWIPSEKSAEAHLAMIQLEQLRDCWRQGWKPTPHEGVYTIKFSNGGLRVYYFSSREFLSFQTKEMAEEFFKCFRDLIEQAGDLI